MNIVIPETLIDHRTTLQEFFDGMLWKLHVNSFKDEHDESDIPVLVDKMLAELEEFKEQVAKKMEDPNSLHELFDLSNFSYLLFKFLRKKGVPDEREIFIKEFFNVDVVAGRIYAKRNRSGSRYREGDEIIGTLRGGRCYIRTQHAISGASISLPRDHIIWWASKGKWPVSDPVHKNGTPSDDRIINLTEAEAGRPKELPFVVQWKPAGKENTTNYGKWCYQRRHRMVLIKVGYWDTAEEAAREGIKAWKSRITT